MRCKYYNDNNRKIITLLSVILYSIKRVNWVGGIEFTESSRDGIKRGKRKDQSKPVG